MLAGVIASVLVLGLGVAAEAMSAASASTPAPASVSTPALPSEFDQYVRAAASCPGLDPLLLVAIHDIETRRDPHGDVSSAGAVGPMQFLPETWATYGVDADHDGHIDPTSLDDALAGAAKLLCADGIADPATHETAIWHYNHSWAYVSAVIARTAELHAATVR
jgi:soluble lytic murein transglycosylase-like protein